MVEKSEAQRTHPTVTCMEMMRGMATGADETAGCPMATMFKGMMKGARFALWLMLPGVALIISGVAMLIEPRILVWLMAGTSILLGGVVLIIASFIKRLGAQSRDA